ncbi:MAG: UDP-glucose 4-epimerase GalE [Chloroflexota bacterium]
MRVLVTGGAGYIGSHTAKLLARSGIEPVVLDNLSTGHRHAVRWGPFVEGDLADTEFVRRVLVEHHIDAVIHFAAHAYVGESMRNPQKYFRNNVVHTLSLLDAMLEVGVRQIVFSSTCATYGLAESLPISELHPQRPTNPYGESKLFVERTLRWYGDIYDLQWIALRYFNAAGADLEGEIGEEHDPEPHLIPLVIKAALGERAQVDIYGTDYPTPDGTAVRDYIHVADLARAHLLGLQYLVGGGDSLALNLGTGQGHSVKDVIGAVERVSGCSVPAREVERRVGDPPILVADARKAADVLQWQPLDSSLHTMVESAWKWFSANVAQNTESRFALT